MEREFEVQSSAAIGATRELCWLNVLLRQSRSTVSVARQVRRR